jgi:hypothetical protein
MDDPKHFWFKEYQEISMSFSDLFKTTFLKNLLTVILNGDIQKKLRNKLFQYNRQAHGLTKRDKYTLAPSTNNYFWLTPWTNRYDT